jgi:hypothetical protein
MEDLSGMQFNNWKVLEYAGKSEWLCECQCEKHTRKLIRTYILKSGGSKSCGCGRVTYQLDSLVGQQFGRWKVLSYEGNSKWLCECQCEKHTRKIVAGRDLKSGGTKSCGCLRHEKADIIGNTYGDLKVIGYNPETYNWICECICGDKSEWKKADLDNGIDHKCLRKAKYENLAGQQFGRWKVLDKYENYKWLCECQCDKHTRKMISRYDLIKGRSTSCGCTRTKYNLEGQTFGRLKVKKYLGNMIYECECSCENHTIVKVATCNLINGGTKSCGCLKNESKYSKEQYIEIINRIIKDTNDLPYVDDIADALDMHRENVKHNIEKYGLQECVNKSFRSKPEREIAGVLETTDIKVSNRTVLHGQELDIYIPEKKLAIEFNGTYWHSNHKVPKKYHQNKTIECAKQGIRLIHIFEYEWNDELKREKLIKMLKTLTNDSRQSIGARETTIKNISQSESDAFLEKYHLQGKAQATVHIGCFYNNELIGVMTLGSPRFNNSYQYEIIRFCWKDDIRVSGGAEKIFSYFIKTYNPTSILTYSDISKFTGNVYTRLGFKPIQPDSITNPNYMWIEKKNNIALTRYQTQKKKLLELGLGTADQSETEIMESNDFLKVYDCGNLRLEWVKSE